MMRAGPTGPDVDRPSAIVSVTVLGVVGSIVFLLLPLLLGAFAENLSLDARQVGFLASADMAGFFIAAAVATLWVRRANWRRVVALAAALLVVCHSLSGFLESLTPLLLVRGTAGFAGGTLMSIALTSLGDTRNPDRFFALFISGQLSLGALALWRMPGLIAAYGLRGVFIALAVVTAAAALCIPWIPKRGQPRESAARGSSRATSIRPGVTALLGCLAFNTGIMAVWAYMERIGNAAGLEPSVIGGALSLSLLAGLFGALVAAALVDRFGRVLPIAASVVLQLVALFLVAGASKREALRRLLAGDDIPAARVRAAQVVIVADEAAAPEGGSA